MRVVVQRVKYAKVSVNGKLVGKIDAGILSLVGISSLDTQQTTEWMANKLANLRVFSDEEGKMNLSVSDISGGILLIPNFTLYGETKKGFRPSYSEAAAPDFSLPYFHSFVEYMKNNYSNKIDIQAGIFGADMQVELINDGPVTLIVEK